MAEKAMNYYEVGQIVNTHGLKGELKVKITTDFPKERFKKGNQLFVEMKGNYQPLTIVTQRLHQGFELLTFAGFTDINEVLPFKTHLLYVTEADQHQLAAGEYYYRDIIGLTIIDATTKAEIGKVKEILAPGANDVWVVTRSGKPDLLLPFLKSVVLKINLEEKTALVDVPLGLDE